MPFQHFPLPMQSLHAMPSVVQQKTSPMIPTAETNHRIKMCFLYCVSQLNSLVMLIEKEKCNLT